MNTRTNELYDLEQHSEEEKRALLKKSEKEDNILEQVPDHLHHAANSVLRNQKKAMVSFNSGGRLSNWAKHQRRSQGRGR